jgi:hypothetical protein
MPLHIEVTDSAGRVESRYVGPNAFELQFAHDTGVCTAECAHCYQDATEVMYLPTRKSPDPIRMLAFQQCKDVYLICSIGFHYARFADDLADEAPRLIGDED